MYLGVFFFSMFTIACTYLVIKIISNKICKTYAILTKYLICQNMYDFGEISLTCLTKYAIFLPNKLSLFPMGSLSCKITRVK
jgi:hypothetical protein